jgi:membrane-associated phospholipid phosphatase
LRKSASVPIIEEGGHGVEPWPFWPTFNQPASALKTLISPEVSMRGRHICTFLALGAFLINATHANAGDPGDPAVSPQPAQVHIPLTPETDSHDNLFHSVGSGMATFGQNIVQDLNVQLHYPFHYARQHPFKFGVGALGLVALVATDRYTQPAMADWAGDAGRARAQKLSDFGNPTTSLYLVGGLGVVGLISGSSREKESSVMLLESLVTSGLWTHSLKTLAGRERPREADAEFAEWEGPHFFGDREEPGKSLRSFPSGHTTGAFAVATVLAHQYPTKGIVPVLAYTGAAAMGYSRVAVGAHWLSDVAVGALIGYGSARTVINNHEQRAAALDRASKLQWGLNLSSDYQGVSVEYDF